MNNLQIYSSPEFGDIRTFIIDNEIWFQLGSICKALKIPVKKAQYMLHPENVMGYSISDSLGRSRRIPFVNKDGVDYLYPQSTSLSAKDYYNWLMTEVTSTESSSQTPIEIALGVDAEGMTTATKLYSYLELNPSNYSKWFRRNIVENEFAEENVDYFRFVLQYESGTG